MLFRCWIEDLENESGRVTLDAFDAEDAARTHVENFVSRGAFCGDPIPQEIDVLVRDADDCLWRVPVATRWEPSFHASTPRRVKS